jgi:hypothetical protein
MSLSTSSFESATPELNTSAPSYGAAETSDAPTPAPAENDLLDTASKVVANSPAASYDDYKAQREDEIAQRRGVPDTPERARAREDRWSRVFSDAEKRTREAIEASDPGRHFEERLNWERAHTASEVRAEIYEATSPGFAERTRFTAEHYGTLDNAAAYAIAASPFSAEICDYLTQNPHEIAILNSMSAQEAAVCVARAEGQLAAGRAAANQQHAAPKQRVVSRAPAPVPTVGGRAHATGKSPADMAYDEYKAWRMAGIRAKEKRA